MYSLAVYLLPPQKVPLAENRFLQARKAAGNTNEKNPGSALFIYS